MGPPGAGCLDRWPQRSGAPLEGRAQPDDPEVLRSGSAQSRRYRRRGRGLPPPQARRSQPDRLLPVPQREDAVLHRQPQQAVLSLLRLRRARLGDRLPDGVQRPELRRGGQGPGRARRGAGARSRARGARVQRQPPATPSVGAARPRSCSRPPQFYKSELRKSERAIDYLKGRGLTGEIAARFGLGFAPGGLAEPARRFSGLLRPARWSRPAW